MKTFKTTTYLIMLLTGIALFNACSKDEQLSSDPFVVAFSSLSKNLMTINAQDTIPLAYSKTALESGLVTIMITETNATYGVDYTTTPAAVGNNLQLQILAGDTSNQIVFHKLNPTLDETTTIEFSVVSIDYSDSNIQGNTNFILNASASLGGSMSPNVGGPNQAYQVFIDLSSETSTRTKRDSWDLGFYSGGAFRVVLNGSIYMAAAPLNLTNIDAVSQSTVSSLQNQVAVGTFDPINENYIDAPNGDILETAIAEVSAIDSENQVYLVNLGYEVGNSSATTGSADIAGDVRGWKKIRLLRDGENYILQYANINDTTHQEVTISKTIDYNFSFFSFDTNSIVTVEPEKDKWDISFTVFTNVIEGAGSYGYSDFVTHNTKGGAKAYKVLTSTSTYADFNLESVSENLLSDNQTAIGGDWRDVFTGAPFNNRFFVLKDPNGNYYKIRFLSLTDNNGERGYPKFEYKLLK